MNVQNTQPVKVLGFKARVTMEQIQKNEVPKVMELHELMSKYEAEKAGPPQWIYHDISEDMSKEFTLEVAHPVKSEAVPTSDYTYSELQGIKCISHTHKGPWSDFKDLYPQLLEQIAKEGHTMSNKFREVYHTVDFENPSNCVTEIQIGIN